MLRILFIVLLLVVAGAAYMWFSVRSIPADYQAWEAEKAQRIERLGRKIEDQGTAKFLGDKFADVLRGEVVFDEDEFNALLLASLASHEDGRRLLAVSDVVRADLRNGEIEVGAIVNMNKLREVEPRAKEAFEQALAVLPFDPGDKIFVAAIGTPIARGGNLAVDSDARLQIGALPISNQLLKRVGFPVEKISSESVPLKSLSIRSVAVGADEIRLNVRPRF